MKSKWTKTRPTKPGYYWCRFVRLGLNLGLPVLPLIAVFFQEKGKKLRWAFCGTGLSPKLIEKHLEWWPYPIPVPPEDGKLPPSPPECKDCGWKARALKGEEAIAALADHRAKPSQQWLATEQARIDEANKKKKPKAKR